jgi:hypothetical protein
MMAIPLYFEIIIWLYIFAIIIIYVYIPVFAGELRMFIHVHPLGASPGRAGRRHGTGATPGCARLRGGVCLGAVENRPIMAKHLMKY